MPAVDELASAVVWTALTLLLRTLPIVLVLPVFGGVRASPVVRTGVALVLCVATWPAIAVAAPEGLLERAQVAASQLALGLIAAIGAMFVFEAARVAGGIADTALGRGSFGADDPFVGQAGALSTAYSLAFAAVFAATGSHRLVVAAFARGQTRFPLDQALSVEALQAAIGDAASLLGVGFSMALALALPALAVALVVDLSLGWMGRVMPQLPVLFLSMPLRMVLGWIVVAAVLGSSLSWAVSAAVEAFAAMAGGSP